MKHKNFTLGGFCPGGFVLGFFVLEPKTGGLGWRFGKAFLMTAIEESHKDILRLLWINCLEAETLEIVIKRFYHLVSGLSPSPFLLNVTLHHRVEKYEDLDSQFVEEFCLAFMLMIYLQEVIPLQILFSCF